ncbi:MAG: hypothetical protein CR217_18610 [Beijerinckiaceae bacterium]|nr:MAG: hypothetical protein CR217_18610 [Beijerinckiaceae bacterium]
MSDYDVGYGKPPKHAQFKKGVCPNPHGRGKRRDLKVAEILNKVLNAKTEFRERGKLKKASRNRIEHQKVCCIGDQG